jgi:hypothetical protein
VPKASLLRFLKHQLREAPSMPVPNLLKTFCANTGIPYDRRQPRRAIFDEVAALSVEGGM